MPFYLFFIFLLIMYTQTFILDAIHLRSVDLTCMLKHYKDKSMMTEFTIFSAIFILNLLFDHKYMQTI